jgi:hypothetical protein
MTSWFTPKWRSLADRCNPLQNLATFRGKSRGFVVFRGTLPAFLTVIFHILRQIMADAHQFLHRTPNRDRKITTLTHVLTPSKRIVISDVPYGAQRATPPAFCHDCEKCVSGAHLEKRYLFSGLK